MMKSNVKDISWNKLKRDSNLKEYIFMTRSGYRHFFVLGKDLIDAEANFMSLDSIKRYGFTLEDLPIRLENKPELKNFTIKDLWNNKENKS